MIDFISYLLDKGTASAFLVLLVMWAVAALFLGLCLMYSIMLIVLNPTITLPFIVIAIVYAIVTNYVEFRRKVEK